MKLHAVGGSREGIIMPVTEYLERNAREYPDEVALVELNPDEKDTRRTTWKEFGLIEPTTYSPVFNTPKYIGSHSRQLYIIIATLSPFLIPLPISMLANLFAFSLNTLHVISLRYGAI